MRDNNIYLDKQIFNINIMHEEAFKYHKLGFLKQAKELYQKILKIDPENAKTLHSLGLLAYQGGVLDVAVDLISKAIKIDPNNSIFYNNLGNVYRDNDMFKEAILCYEYALQLEPSLSAVYINMGNLYKDKKMRDEAVKCYGKALCLNPNLADAHYNMGNIYKDLGQIDEAISSYKMALTKDPNLADAYYNMGNAYRDSYRFDEAISSYKAALDINPNMTFAHHNLGDAYKNQGMLNEAIRCYQNAIEINSDYAEGYNSIGNALKDEGKLEEAIIYYNKALQIKPDYAYAYYNLANIFQNQGKFEKAISYYCIALHLKPSSIEVYNNIGNAYLDQGCFDRALFYYQEGLKKKPSYAEIIFNQATTHLLKGNLIKGWEGYEWRFRRSAKHTVYIHSYDKPRWDGSFFRGKRLFVHAEQGLGDALQFVRYLPMVKARGGTVIFESPKQLFGLMQNFPGIDELTIMSYEKKSDKEFDFYIPLMSLPWIFKTTIDTIPAKIPYFSSDPIKCKYWRRRLAGDGFKVGLVWSGQYRPPYDRFILLEKFAPICKIKGVRLYGLQKGDAAGQIDRLPEDMQIINLGDELVDFTDTAALIENLDLIISIDTSVVHLAGAMAKPTWVLLRFIPDFRWLMHREDSPWYPTVRLFRQSVRGDWDSVILKVARELSLLQK